MRPFVKAMVTKGSAEMMHVASVAHPALDLHLAEPDHRPFERYG